MHLFRLQQQKTKTQQETVSSVKLTTCPMLALARVILD